MKKLISIILIIVVLIITTIFLLKGCEPRKKEKTISTENYQNSFINANVAMTCLLYNESKIEENQPALATNVEKVYKQYGLPTEDNALMVKILQQYENDTETINTIKTNAAPCREGLEGTFL